MGEGVECQYDDTNLIDSVSQVHSEEECRQLCEDQQDCEFITFFNASSTPFSNFCRLFNTCENTEECENCVTQNLDCYRTCGYNFVGHMDENIIDTIDNTKSELDCKKHCSQTNNCSFYTYYSEEDHLYHELCVLLTEILPPFEPTDSVSSGPADCSSASEECSFEVNGVRVESLMVTEEEVEVLVNPFGSCEITILAVGGGGRGNYQGGGSGYLQYLKKNIFPSSGITSLNAKAGSAAEASSVTYNGSIVLVQANPGQGGDSDNSGGDGYSGGGRYGCSNGGGYDGGSDGSDGEGSLGGSGTGEDIREYVFTTWTLTPGAGGIHYTSGGGNCWGRGGVHTDGLQGLVLLEISSTQK